MSSSYRRCLPWLAITAAAVTPLLWYAVSLSAPALRNQRTEVARFGHATASSHAATGDGRSTPSIPFSPGDVGQRMYSNAQADTTCAYIHGIDPSTDVNPVDPPSVERRRIAQACATRNDTSADDIVSRMQAAADAGNKDAKLYLAQRRVDADSADVDALASQLTAEELPLLRERYTNDIRALSDLALTGDAAAARRMADLQSAGKLLPSDSVKAAGWQVYANAIDRPGDRADETLLRDPALDDLDQATSVAAVAFARSLLEQNPFAQAHRPLASP